MLIVCFFNIFEIEAKTDSHKLTISFKSSTIDCSITNQYVLYTK